MAKNPNLTIETNPSVPAGPAPSVGRIVHYHDITQEQPVAAIITKVGNDGRHVNLCGWYDTEGEGTFLMNVDYSESAPGPDRTWSWPPRV